MKVKNPFRKNDAPETTKLLAPAQTGVIGESTSTDSYPPQALNNSPYDGCLSIQAGVEQAELLNKIIEESRKNPSPTQKFYAGTVIRQVSVPHEDNNLAQVELDERQRKEQLSTGYVKGTYLLGNTPERRLHSVEEFPSLNLKKTLLRRDVPYSVHEFLPEGDQK